MVLGIPKLWDREPGLTAQVDLMNEVPWLHHYMQAVYIPIKRYNGLYVPIHHWLHL